MSFKENIALTMVFLIGLLFYGYEFFLRLINGAYEKQIVEYFHLSSKFDYSFLVSSYSLTYLLMQIPCGIILDRFESKYVFSFAILICGLGNIIFLSPVYSIAVIGRLLIGFGSAFAFIGVLKISREYFSSTYFSLLASIAISFGTLAGIFSQQISVFLSDTGIDWKIIFLISGLVSLPLALISFVVLSQKKRKSINFFNGYGIDTYLSLIKNKLLWLNSAWGGFIYIPTVILSAQFGVLFFSDIYGFNQYHAVKEISFLLMDWVVFSPIMILLAKLFGMAKVIILSSVISVVIIFSLTMNVDLFRVNISILVFLLGCFSAAQVLVWQLFNKFCKPEFTALGIALTNMIITGITECGQLFSGFIMDKNNLIHWLIHEGIIYKVVQVNILIFMLSIILGITLMALS
ncbi:MFS transporter [Facilibium subflavum]|uniref:MFS transporter n=1 Tax=Facilibium subflavum TaxID=2219058 RepID=UPI0013C2B9DF|nr:MFS transporter [Facilibium subflavum]